MDNVTGSENRGPLSELETEAEAEEEEPGAAALEDPEEQPTSIPAAIAAALDTAAMGIAVVGGMVCSTLLTLFVIPAIYTYLSSKEVKIIEEIED